MNIRNIFNFFIPAVCELCGDDLVAGEKIICSRCLASIRPTRLHTIRDNRLRSKLPQSAPIVMVGAFANYTRKSDFAALIRRAKYNDRPDIVRYLTRIYTRQLIDDGALNGIEMIQSIPMYPLKRLIRGFNQTEEIASEMSTVSGIPTIKALRAIKPHSSQTTHTAAERAINVRGTFAIDRPELISGRHIALVDDIFTTGATLSEAIKALQPATPSQISVFTLAVTVHN